MAIVTRALLAAAGLVLLAAAEIHAEPDAPAREEASSLAGASGSVREYLPAGTAFIELVWYAREPNVPENYVAFIVAAGRPGRRVELGAAAPIDRLVADWRRAIVGWQRTLPAHEQRALEAEADRVAVELGRRVWAKLAAHLPDDVGTVYLAPAGNLSRLPWAALPGRKPGTVLLEDYALAVVPNGSFLLERLRDPPLPADAAAPVLVVGGVHDDLPASAQEVARLRELAGSRRVVVLDGDMATPERVRSELPRAQIAHLATHGFNSPFANAGLILAGGDDRGVLSGEGLAGLPLKNLRLAVLSACETGVGGLVRAFHSAGCRDVVASLWTVNDEATAVLMTEFYRQLWAENQPPIEALRRAQLDLYRIPERVPAQAGADRGPPNPGQTQRVGTTPAAAPSAYPKTGAGTAPSKWWASFVLFGTGQ